jgi:hypothetical protein
MDEMDDGRFVLFSYLRPRKNCKTYKYKAKMKKISIRSGIFPRFFTIFAKNTAHNERRLRKNAYLCIVAENPSQT